MRIIEQKMKMYSCLNKTICFISFFLQEVKLIFKYFRSFMCQVITTKESKFLSILLCRKKVSD